MKKIIILSLACCLLLTTPFLTAQALTITPNPTQAVHNDVAILPAKVELVLDPGAQGVKNIVLLNRSGKKMKISVRIEDFTGDDEVAVKLLGSERGKNSGKDYLSVDKKDFTLAHGDKAMVPVKISIPADARPGALYAAVIFSATPEGSAGQVTAVSSLSSLFFMRIKGDYKEEGAITAFNTDHTWYQTGPVKMTVKYTNTGDVYVAPFGDITITSFSGDPVAKITLAPWFVMPGTSRVISQSYEQNLPVGIYKAQVDLNKGYKDLKQSESTWFIVLPFWRILVAVLALMLVGGAWWKWRYQKSK